MIFNKLPMIVLCGKNAKPLSEKLYYNYHIYPMKFSWNMDDYPRYRIISIYDVDTVPEIMKLKNHHSDATFVDISPSIHYGKHANIVLPDATIEEIMNNILFK